jgi:hypothetical protein
MTPRRLSGWIALLVVATGAVLVGASIAGQTQPTFDPGNFVAGVNHPFFPLQPGKTFHYTAQTVDGTETEEMTVTNETKSIMGVSATVVHDQVFLNGSLTEDTFDWYAQDRQGNVWYLGEDSRQFENGRQVGTEGSWEAGRQGATPGVVMLADPQNGDSYAQENAPGIAEDMAKVSSLKSVESVPYGTFSDCLETMEWSALNPGGKEHKFYARGVGLILEVSPKGGKERNELTSITP